MTNGGSRRLWCIAALLAALLAGCGGGSRSTGPSSSTAVSPANFDFGGNDPLKVTAFGDSITRGELGEPGLVLRRSAFRVTANNYPNNLQAMLRGVDPGWRVVNRGESGETTGEGVRRLPGVLSADHPGFVLVMEGTNDASRELDPRSIVGNLESMVSQVQANHSVPVIGTIPPNFRNDPGAQAIIAEANRMIRDLARARGVVLAEIFDGMNDPSLFATPAEGIVDPLHPNERGYQVMAGIWFEAMQRAIPRGTGSQQVARQKR